MKLMKGDGGHYKITDKDRIFVAMLTVAGTSQYSIASALGIDLRTLKGRFKDEINTALELATEKATSTVLQKIDEGDLQASMFFLKCRAKWADRTEIAVDQIREPRSKEEIEAELREYGLTDKQLQKMVDYA